MFYEGMSLHGIRRNLEQTYRNRPSNSTIYEWVIKFTKQAIKIAEDYKPEVGDVWVADETVLKIEGENVWFWDIIDEKTRFLLATHISSTRTIRDTKTLLERAVRRAGKIPEVIITDKLAAYISGIELTLGTGTKHIRAKRLTAEPGTQLAERFHGTLPKFTTAWPKLKLKTVIWRMYVHYFFSRLKLSSNARLAMGTTSMAQLQDVMISSRQRI
jgi:transposase-like protein